MVQRCDMRRTGTLEVEITASAEVCALISEGTRHQARAHVLPLTLAFAALARYSIRARGNMKKAGPPTVRVLAVVKEPWFG